MENLKNKSVLVIDDGMFIEFAIRLSRDFGAVYYWSNWKSEYPKSKDDRIGYGVPGIERVSEVYDYIDEVDLIVFTSIYHGDWQQWLREKGYRVWGSGRGDVLERDRLYANEYYKELKLPQPKLKKVIGIQALKDYLEDKTDKWIKVSQYRGENETWHWIDKNLSARKINRIEQLLGDEGKIFEFLVFDPINGDDIVECGYDGFNIDGQWPSKTIAGYEKKDCAYLCKVKNYADISPIITSFNDAITPTLKANQYRSFISTEIRVGKDKVPYMIDGTMRMPSPPGELYYEMIENFSEIVWEGSNGVLVEPIWTARYGIEIMINSQDAENQWHDVKFPKSIRQWVKLRNLAIIDDVYCIIPRHGDFNNIGAVIAIGSSIEEVVKKAKGYCEQITGEGIDCKVNDIKPLLDIIAKGKEIGLSF